jgi:Heterokaryon incompatibility protein (HET)
MSSPQQAADPAPMDATKATKLKADQFFRDYIPEDQEEAEEKKWLNKERVQAFRRAFWIFMIEKGLPQDQRWMWYMLMVYFHEDLDPPLYVYSIIPIALLWYFPQISVIIVFGITAPVDVFKRTKYKSNQEMVRNFGSMNMYLVPLLLMISYISLEGMTESLESLFGPRHIWVTAILPTLPGLLLQILQERSSVNGFVPEGTQGILMAIFIRACAVILPLPVQWLLWVSYSTPDWQNPSILVEWIFCTITWFYYRIPPQGAYALHLLVNQWPHPQAWFRHYGGGPSVILKRERLGTRWFITTSVIMAIIEAKAGPMLMENGYLNLSPQIWLPLAIIFILEHYFLRYGIDLRLSRYQHRPLETNETIRLLRLRAQPCLPDSPVQCEIIHSSIHNPPPYIAISHRWADPGEEEIILIDGAPFLVSPNIYNLLVAKRSAFRHVILWIDSICIDQRNLKEKGRQVGMMKRIFEEASCTIGWLGDEPYAEKAFGLLERIRTTGTISNYVALLEENDAGWTELQQLVSRGWFERVWIIQEIAVSKNTILRYGKKEVEWTTFANALFCLLGFAFASGRSRGFEESRELLNALVMENIRIQAEDADYLKLKDTLKLGLRFKATLPIDKVYGLLGIAEERYTPPFHPRTNSFEEGVDPFWYEVKNLILMLDEITDIMGTLSGISNTRKGCAVISSGRGIRHITGLAKDFGKMTQRLRRVRNGKGDSGANTIRPDYSEKTTPELVYTAMARDIVKEGDPFSFLCHAGIGLIRNLLLSNLPSWVPDWSTDPDNYLLPRLRGQTENPKQSEAKESKASENATDTKKVIETETTKESQGSESNEESNDQIVLDAGPKFLHIKATIVGPIEHLAILSKDLKPSTLDDIDHAREDFYNLFYNYVKARALAREHTKSRYLDEEAAFYRTTLADMDGNGNSLVPEDIDTWRHWIQGTWERCPILAALQPDDFEHTEEAEKLKYRSKICKQYLFRRRMQSSANAKFAHLVRTEIAPSFAKYRWRASRTNTGKETKDGIEVPLREEKEGKGEQATEWERERNRVISMLDNYAGPLTGYIDYVDYTIGRKFAITDSGHMGLVPAGAKEGDLVVFIEQENLFFTLRREDYVEQAEGESEANERVMGSSKGKAKTNSAVADDTSCDETFRLVGQSYIHDLKLDRRVEKENWFKIW